MFFGDSQEDSKRFNLVKCTEHKLHDERRFEFSGPIAAPKIPLIPTPVQLIFPRIGYKIYQHLW